MGIVTPPLRKVIKVLLITKYIEQCGIKLPKLPNIPNFVPPPMPDLKFIEEELAKIQEAMMNSANNESIYTTEYIEAYKQYKELTDQAKQELDAKLEEIEKEFENAPDVIDLEYMTKKLNSAQDVDKAWNDYELAVIEARDSTNIDNITKFKRIDAKNKKKANKAAKDETESKKNDAKQEALKEFIKMALKQYTEWCKQEAAKVKRFIEEIKQAYEDSVALFNQVKDEAKAYFQDGGPGDAFVEQECDKIDRFFENFTEAFKELIVDIATLAAKIPNPDVLVAGAAVGIPNPGHKIMVFMEDMKKILADIKKITNYIKDILAIAKALGFAISESISAFKKLCDEFESKQKDVDKAFKEAVKNIRKRNKWYLEHVHPDDEGEKRLAGYMYTDAEVDWANHEIKVKGYKCYCRKDFAKIYLDDELRIQKSWWVGGYRKNGGPYTDSTGKRYYYIPEEEMGKIKEYDESDITESMRKDAELAAKYGYDLGDYDVDLGTSYDASTNTTRLQLSDGRTITIDYLAASGDIIRLDDGSIIKVK